MEGGARRDAFSPRALSPRGIGAGGAGLEGGGRGRVRGGGRGGDAGGRRTQRSRRTARWEDGRGAAVPPAQGPGGPGGREAGRPVRGVDDDGDHGGSVSDGGGVLVRNRDRGRSRIAAGHLRGERCDWKGRCSTPRGIMATTGAPMSAPTAGAVAGWCSTPRGITATTGRTAHSSVASSQRAQRLAASRRRRGPPRGAARSPAPRAQRLAASRRRRAARRWTHGCRQRRGCAQRLAASRRRRA